MPKKKNNAVASWWIPVVGVCLYLAFNYFQGINEKNEAQEEKTKQFWQEHYRKQDEQREKIRALRDTLNHPGKYYPKRTYSDYVRALDGKDMAAVR